MEQDERTPVVMEIFLGQGEYSDGEPATPISITGKPLPAATSMARSALPIKLTGSDAATYIR